MSIFIEEKVKKAFVGNTKVKQMWFGTTKVWVATQQIYVPTVSGTYTYNGSSQSVSLNGYDSNKMTISGTMIATNAGTYTMTFTPKEEYSWDEDGDDISPRNVTWTINKKSISGATITLSTTSFNYDGTTKTVSITSVKVGNLDATFTTSGSTSAVSSGTHTITATGTGNFTGTQNTTWKIIPIALTIPTLSNTTKTYAYETTQSPTVNNFNPTYETQGGTSSAINAGTYSVTWSLKDTTNTCWSDGTTETKSGEWSIGKAGSSWWSEQTSFSGDTHEDIAVWGGGVDGVSYSVGISSQYHSWGGYWTWNIHGSWGYHSFRAEFEDIWTVTISAPETDNFTASSWVMTFDID